MHDQTSSRTPVRETRNLSRRSILATGLALIVAAATAGVVSAGPPAASPQGKPMSFHDLSAKDIDGKDVSFKQYQGRVALVVNVASQCGFTPQYAGLQKLHTEYKDKGLVVLGFPSNEFGAQEPGTEAEIKSFCSLKYNVNFPMFSKVSVKKGDQQSPVYQFLTQKEAAPRWNFSKYLVGKDGQVIASFASNVAPESPELRQAIDKALATP